LNSFCSRCDIRLDKRQRLRVRRTNERLKMNSNFWKGKEKKAVGLLWMRRKLKAVALQFYHFISFYQREQQQQQQRCQVFKCDTYNRLNQWYNHTIISLEIAPPHYVWIELKIDSFYSLFFFLLWHQFWRRSRSVFFSSSRFYGRELKKTITTTTTLETHLVRDWTRTSRRLLFYVFFLK